VTRYQMFKGPTRLFEKDLTVARNSMRGAVYRAVVDGQRHVHARLDLEVAVDDDGASSIAPTARMPACGGFSTAAEALDTVHAEVRDRERATSRSSARSFALARARDDVRARDRDLRIVRARSRDHRDDEPVRERHRRCRCSPSGRASPSRRRSGRSRRGGA
jgi:hypothetical protein